MNRIIFYTICMIGLLFSSCKKDPIAQSNSDYIIFGHFYGECSGERCIEIFKLEKDKIFEDKNDFYPNFKSFYTGDFFQISQDYYEYAKDLNSSFPKDLLNDSTTVFGYPDASDGGGLYVEYNFDGIRKFWIFDQFKKNVPEKYHFFMDEVNRKIGRIK